MSLAQFIPHCFKFVPFLISFECSFGGKSGKPGEDTRSFRILTEGDKLLLDLRVVSFGNKSSILRVMDTVAYNAAIIAAMRSAIALFSFAKNCLKLVDRF
jgi:hypothetical protein